MLYFMLSFRFECLLKLLSRSFDEHGQTVNWLFSGCTSLLEGNLHFDGKTSKNMLLLFFSVGPIFLWRNILSILWHKVKFFKSLESLKAWKTFIKVVCTLLFLKLQWLLPWKCGNLSLAELSRISQEKRIQIPSFFHAFLKSVWLLHKSDSKSSRKLALTQMHQIYDSWKCQLVNAVLSRNCTERLIKLLFINVTTTRALFVKTNNDRY